MRSPLKTWNQGALSTSFRRSLFQWMLGLAHRMPAPFLPTLPACGLAAQLLLALGGAQVVLAQAPGGPPGAEAAVEQKGDHVGLGEELGDGGQLVGADRDLGAVDLVFPLGLPELEHPAEAVGCLEAVRAQTG